VQKYREFSAMGPLVGHQRVSLKHGFEPPGDVTGLVPDACEMLQVAADLALVPGDQDGLNVGKYLYSVARPTPVSAAIFDIVTDASPCSVTSLAVASRVASRTARRCSSTVSARNFGTRPSYTQ
jgi:hypothetical protein